jgi:4-diphosphocytidyl-2-C-methyl-D-erythritol kinase
MKSEKLILPSFAKINIFLRVLGKRPADNYHELCTIFQTVSLKDEISFEPDPAISLTCDNPLIPANENNLIVKVANLLKKQFSIEKGVKIHLKKNIPAPGGLGGGSSNAAVTLLGLAHFWKLPIKKETLVEIGKSLGADIPFFFLGGTVLGRGTGTDLIEMENWKENHLLIITPNVEISTPRAYSDLNAPYLTKKGHKSILTICRNLVENQFSTGFHFINDFEKTVFLKAPEVKEVKDKILESGAKKALMSGSGASIFGIFDNKEKQQIAFQAFEKENVQRFAVKTISRQEYINSLRPCL